MLSGFLLTQSQKRQTPDTCGIGKKVKNGLEGWVRVGCLFNDCCFLSGKVHSSFSHLRVMAYFGFSQNVAMMTQRIDEVQAGVASRGLGWKWSNQMWREVGLGWTRRGTWWRSWCYSLPSLTIGRIQTYILLHVHNNFPHVVYPPANRRSLLVTWQVHAGATTTSQRQRNSNNVIRAISIPVHTGSVICYYGILWLFLLKLFR